MMTKKAKRAILADIRQQVKWIQQAIDNNEDQDYLEQLGMQLSATALNFEWMPFLLFLSYLLYGFLRPFLSREMKRDIEEEEDDESAAPH
jgi:hypothetical protein